MLYSPSAVVPSAPATIKSSPVASSAPITFTPVSAPPKPIIPARSARRSFGCGRQATILNRAMFIAIVPIR